MVDHSAGLVSYMWDNVSLGRVSGLDTGTELFTWMEQPTPLDTTHLCTRDSESH
jgi:hypothetical protein